MQFKKFTLKYLIQSISILLCITTILLAFAPIVIEQSTWYDSIRDPNGGTTIFEHSNPPVESPLLFQIQFQLVMVLITGFIFFKTATRLIISIALNFFSFAFVLGNPFLYSAVNAFSMGYTAKFSIYGIILVIILALLFACQIILASYYNNKK